MIELLKDKIETDLFYERPGIPAVEQQGVSVPMQK